MVYNNYMNLKEDICFMNEILTGGKSYRTERFCSVADHNIILSVESRIDGSEKKTCHNINECAKKHKCRYLPQSDDQKNHVR